MTTIRYVHHRNTHDGARGSCARLRRASALVAIVLAAGAWAIDADAAPVGARVRSALGPSAPTSTAASSTSSSAASSTAAATTTAGSQATPSSDGSSLAPTSTTTDTGAPVTTAVTTTTLPTLTVGAALRLGSKGDRVLALERRLDELKIDTGPVDGKYDWATWGGVLAFQKLEGLDRTGKAGEKTQQALIEAINPDGLLPNGGLPRVEIDISRQILMYFGLNGLERIVPVSSGSGKKYCDYSKKSQREVCGSAHTPRGNFRVQRRIKGDRESDLGHLYNPVYFSGGYAVHGSPSVPGYPASHGCVRVTNRVADWFFETVKDGTPVYIYD